MGMTLTEKILARHAGVASVEPGQIINAKVDLVLANELSAAVAIGVMRNIKGADRVFDNERIALVEDHFVPAKDAQSAKIAKLMKDFAVEQKIKHFFDVGRGGIEHVVLPEEGLVAPGELIVGGDSHTCTYGAFGAFATGMGSTDIAAAFVLGEVWLKVPPTIKIIYNGNLGELVFAKDIMLKTVGTLGIDGATYRAIEYHGTTVDNLSITGRITMANMAIEAGAKNGIFHADAKTIAYVKERTDRDFTVERADADAHYERVIEIDVSELEPQVACPHTPDNVHPISEVTNETIPVDQVFIGSCTNGYIEDLRVVASILEGKRIAPTLRVIVNPGSQKVWMQAATGRHSHDACGRRLRGQYPRLRRVLRRTHGNAGRRRALHLHDEPQLRGPHGFAQSRSLSGIARDVRRIGAYRTYHRSAHALTRPVILRSRRTNE